MCFALTELFRATLAKHARAIEGMLGDKEPRVRRAAVLTLGKLELAALAEHADAILGRLKDSDPEVRLAAVKTLGRLEPTVLWQHNEAIASMTKHSDEKVREFVLGVNGAFYAPNGPGYEAAMLDFEALRCA